MCDRAIMKKNIFLLIFFSVLIISLKSQPYTFLPKPAGEYFVGTRNVFFTDKNRKEKLTVKCSDRRSLQVKIWYPSDRKGEIENQYLKDYSAEILAKSYKVFSDEKSFFDSLKSYNTFSYENIPVSKKEEKFPVIFFSPGFYFGLDDFYSSIMENLASHGYIVVSVTHPYDQVIANSAEGKILKLNKYRMFKAYMQWKKVELFHTKTPDSTGTKKTIRILNAYFRGMKVFDKSLDIWVKDVQFVLDTLEKINNGLSGELFYRTIDFSKVGALGQSFGGAVAGQLCYIDKRFKAGVNLDCFQFGDVYDHEMKKPFMLLYSDSYPLWTVANKIIYTGTNPFYSFNIKNTKHFIFSDCCIFPAQSNKKLRELIGPGDGMVNVKLINEYIIDFFDHYLKQIPLNSKQFQTN